MSRTFVPARSRHGSNVAALVRIVLTRRAPAPAGIGIGRVAKAFADLADPERQTKIIVEPWR